MPDQWESCYDDGWQGDIVPEAFAHPAKFSRGLIHRIYKHAKEMGWCQAGDYVLDPFGGVALGGLDALSMGLNWIGVELEEKFVSLGEQNIELWNRQLKGWPNLGTARIVQGDSRRLKDIILSIAFLSWEEDRDYPTDNRDKELIRLKKDGLTFQEIGDKYNLSRQRVQQIVKRECSFDFIVSSPPYAESLQNAGGKRLPSWFNSGNKNMHDEFYGHTPGNLANLKEGNYQDATFGDLGNRFWDKVEKGDGCWEWKGITNGKRNYGQLWFEGRHQLAHRVSWKIHFGEILDGINVLHRCDNTRCVNPDHLFLGSQGDNMKDAYSKGRKEPPPSRGEENGNSKLNEEDVLNIYNDYHSGKYSYIELCEKYNIGQSHFYRIVNKQAWKDVLPLKEGDIDMVVGSPPYADSVNSGPSGIDHSKSKGGRNRAEEVKRTGCVSCQAIGEQRYGHSPGQLGSMKEGPFDLCVSSPPWENIQPFGKAIDFVVQDNRPERKGTDWQRKAIKDRPHGGYIPDYGGSKNQLGNSSGDTFWASSKIIVQGCYDLLKPNGMSIWVCKDYVKAKKRVPFSDRWLALCESVGFKLVCRHQAMLVKEHGTQVTIHGEEKITTQRKSFFRRLAESKGSPRIDFEDIICLIKEI